MYLFVEYDMIDAGDKMEINQINIKNKKINWVHFESPTQEELLEQLDGIEITDKLVQSIMDMDEVAEFNYYHKVPVIHFDVPVETSRDPMHQTSSMSIIWSKDKVITVGHDPYPLVEYYNKHIDREYDTVESMILTLLEVMIDSYIPSLKKIQKQSQLNDAKIKKEMSNRALYDMLELQKSLVYFSASITENDAVISRILNDWSTTLQPNDLKRLNEVQIESKQVMAMASIYQEIIDTTSSVMGSIISNNVNDVMKVLAVFTIIQGTPMIIAGVYGMNVTGLPFPTFIGSMVVTIIATIITWFLLKKSRIV